MERLREIRKAAKMSRQDLANALGVHYTAVSAWERDIYPLVRRLIKLCDVLQVTSDYLLGTTSVYYKTEGAGIRDDALTKKEIGDRIRAERKLLKITQAEAGNRIGVKQTVYATWEKGQQYPEVKNLIAIARCFDVSIDYILGRTKYRDPIDKRIQKKIEKAGRVNKAIMEDEDFFEFMEKLDALPDNMREHIIALVNAITD